MAPHRTHHRCCPNHLAPEWKGGPAGERDEGRRAAGPRASRNPASSLGCCANASRELGCILEADPGRRSIRSRKHRLVCRLRRRRRGCGGPQSLLLRRRGGEPGDGSGHHRRWRSRRETERERIRSSSSTGSARGGRSWNRGRLSRMRRWRGRGGGARPWFVRRGQKIESKREEIGGDRERSQNI